MRSGSEAVITHTSEASKTYARTKESRARMQQENNKNKNVLASAGLAGSVAALTQGSKQIGEKNANLKNNTSSRHYNHPDPDRSMVHLGIQRHKRSIQQENSQMTKAILQLIIDLLQSIAIILVALDNIRRKK